MLNDSQTYHRSLVSSSLATGCHSADTDLCTHLGLGTEWLGTRLLCTDHTHNCPQKSVEEVVDGKQQKVQRCSGGYHNDQYCCIKFSALQCKECSPDLHTAPHNQAHHSLMLANCLQKPRQRSQSFLAEFENHPWGHC